MLLAHGTTRKNADKIEKRGYFGKHVYFLKFEPDFKQAIFGTVCFALRDHSLTPHYIDMYCKQDLIIKLFKKSLIKKGYEYIEQKRSDKTEGLIYIVDASEEILDYHKGFLRNLFLPTELFSTEKIPTTQVEYILTLEENKKYFQERYGYKVKSLEDLILDKFNKRVYNTIKSRVHRLIIKRKWMTGKRQEK